jgi:hypothetical protein
MSCVISRGLRGARKRSKVALHVTALAMKNYRETGDLRMLFIQSQRAFDWETGLSGGR